MLLCLVTLGVAYGGGLLFEGLDIGPRRELRAAMAAAEEQVANQRQLMSRAEQIHAAYRKLDSPAVTRADTAHTETEILRGLSEMAGPAVHVKSVVPRLGHHEGTPVMFVALDCEGPFLAVLGYLERILTETSSEVSNLSLAPQAGADGVVVCRISIRVGGLETATGT
jgi:hypothetical protein